MHRFSYSANGQRLAYIQSYHMNWYREMRTVTDYLSTCFLLSWALSSVASNLAFNRLALTKLLVIESGRWGHLQAPVPLPSLPWGGTTPQHCPRELRFTPAQGCRCAHLALAPKWPGSSPHRVGGCQWTPLPAPSSACQTWTLWVCSGQWRWPVLGHCQHLVLRLALTLADRQCVSISKDMNKFEPTVIKFIPPKEGN